MSKPLPPMLPGAKPLVGHALEFQNARNALFEEGLRTIGPIFALRLANRRAAVLIGPDYHELFFTETDKRLSMHKTYRFLRAMFGDVAFAADPETYVKQRPVLHLPFKGAKMPGYLEIMQAEIQRWLDGLGESGEMELTAEITELVQNVAAHALMGRQFRDEMGREFWDHYTVLGQSMDLILPPDLPLPKFRRRDRARDALHEMVWPLIAERRANPDAYDDFLNDFVHATYADGEPVEEDVIANLIVALMFAGHETTAGQAAWTIIQLLQHPDYLALARAELDEQLAPGTALDMRTLGHLQHVRWAVDETTRMHPSADLLLRMAEEDIDVGGYRIPAGWMVIVTAGTAHRLEEWFEEPHRYDPLRFAPGRAEDRGHRFAMIGFGGGTHKCAGMNFANAEMALIAALLFRQFDLELVTRNPGVHYGLGASRPQPTLIRYRRRAGLDAPAPAAELRAGA